MKKLVALTLSSAFIMSSAFAFSDLTENHWAYRNVMDMQEKGIISGFEDSTFRPSDVLTREQFITMAVKGLKLEDLASTVFEDVSGRWSEEFIKIAGDSMVDVGETTFRPSEVALREDVAMAIVKLNKLPEDEYNLDVLRAFSDSNEISENRRKYVALAVENGFMSGNANGTFSPKKALTRAEGATVVFNMLNEEVEDVVNWDGEYISNVDGLVKVKLTKRSNTEVQFYIKGAKSSTFAINNVATITEDSAKYVYDMFDEYGEINFSFSGTDLIIETLGYEELAVFNGRYSVDDGSVSTIVRTVEKNSLEGEYLLGEKIETPEFETMEELEKFLQTAPLSLAFGISDIGEEAAIYTLGGFVDGSMLVRMGSLQKVGDKWQDVDEYEEGSNIEVEFVEGNVVIRGLNEDNEILNGTYIKQIEKVEDEFREAEELINGMEVDEGGFMY